MQQGVTQDAKEKVTRFMNLEELTMKPRWLAILVPLVPKGKSDLQWLGLKVNHSVIQKTHSGTDHTEQSWKPSTNA